MDTGQVHFLEFILRNGHLIFHIKLDRGIGSPIYGRNLRTLIRQLVLDQIHSHYSYLTGFKTASLATILFRTPTLFVQIKLWPLGAFTEDEQKIIRDATEKISGKYYNLLTTDMVWLSYENRSKILSKRLYKWLHNILWWYCE